MPLAKPVLPIIVFAQFCCTSIWFATNAVMIELVAEFQLEASALGHLTSAVQIGFIVGTLIFALFTVSDRFPPSKVFFISATLGAAFNLCTVWKGNDFASLVVLRFLTGFFLAGIYPVGMKIASDYFEKGLGKSLGFLVGALVLGTAFPHLLKSFGAQLQWESVILATSALAMTGGLLMVSLVPNGPHRNTVGSPYLSSFYTVFRNQNFRSAAFGYFGHMWELYAFWAFVPLMLRTYTILHPETDLNIPLLSFCIIGVGGLACVIGGYVAQWLGTKQTAFLALLLSGVCCLASPFVFALDSQIIFIGFLLFWGITVIADSPLFSTLVAQNAPSEARGTALTIVNSIGFALTILSIQIISSIQKAEASTSVYALLAVGPFVGLVALKTIGKHA